MYFPTSSALIEFLILAVLEQGDSYGYEISQTIKLIANIKESTLYPILKKLEASGFLTTYSREFQGRMRKYYSLTNREMCIRDSSRGGLWGCSLKNQPIKNRKRENNS